MNSKAKKQGAAPEKWQLEACEFTMKRFAGLYGFRYDNKALVWLRTAESKRRHPTGCCLFML